MSKIRLVLAGAALSALAGTAALIPAGAASADTSSTTATTSTSDPLPLIVCLTIEPKSVTIDTVEIGPVGLPTTCVTVVP